MTSTAAASRPTERVQRAAVAAESPLVPRWAVGVLGLCLVGFGAVLVYCLVAVWPSVNAASRGTKPVSISPFGHEFAPSADAALLLLVVVSSALGSYVHAATSFTDYVGNRKLATSWIWWYVLRGFIGSALALLFYFAIRGGFLGANAPSEVINPYGIAAVSGLVGLFSKQATDKLREIFDTLFRTAPGKGDDSRGDSIANPRPVLAGLEPSRTEAGSGLVEVVLSGQGFVPASVVRLERAGELLERDVAYVGPGELRIGLREEDVAAAGTLTAVVFNPPPGGGISSTAVLEVVPTAPTPP
jgi:hypothetical protein